MMENNFDIIVIGSGLGGLECGTILSREGYKVCLLEQHSLFGGCLQSFQRRGCSFDTGIHYIGSMDEGQIMRQYFKYMGINDRLSTIKLDSDFDVITFGDGAQYSYNSGYDEFQHSLISRFPDERLGIEKYCKKIQAIGSSIDIETHRKGYFSRGGLDNLSISAVQYIEDCVLDPTLRNLLAGTNVLYGGEREASNLYHHAMINHANIEGAYRFVGSTQRVADLFIEQIRANGGYVESNCKVVSINVDGADVKSITLQDGRELTAKSYISNLHPKTTFDMVSSTPSIKKAYRSRLSLLPNTYGLYSVYLKMKPNSFEYINKNYYYYSGSNVWDSVMGEDLEPKAILLSAQLKESRAEYSDVVTLMSPIANSVFKPWNSTSLNSRGDDYLELKGRIDEKIIDYTTKFHPNLAGKIESIYSASPLTFQHYTTTPQGSAYGILKDYRTTMATLMPSKTKLSNLYLTGQNLNVHGAIGVTLTAATTCAEFLGVEYLAKKIGGA